MKLNCAMNVFLRTLVIYLCIIQLASAAFLRYCKGSLEDCQVTPLNQPLPPGFLSSLDFHLPIIIYTFGYNGRVHGPATTAVMSTYISTKKRNVLLLDWEEEAKSGLLGFSLGYALSAFPKSKQVGKELGERLIDIAGAGYNMTNVHLIGHSLGAQVMGFAGRRARELGYVVPRITGLDPAKAMFEGAFAIQRGLDRTCGKFVVIIHTDANGYGTSSSTGSVDIWPNSGRRQPGCTREKSMFADVDKLLNYKDSVAELKKKSVTEILRAIKRTNYCDHDRSWQYYVEAILSPTAFPATAAPDYDSWAANLGNSSDSIYLGELTRTSAQGNYYLVTNSESPFGKGTDGLKPKIDLMELLPRMFYFR